jgi:hypothetical protein
MQAVMPVSQPVSQPVRRAVTHPLTAEGKDGWAVTQSSLGLGSQQLGQSSHRTAQHMLPGCKVD